MALSTFDFLTPETVETLGPKSSARLKELRREGWEHFQSLPWPVKTDEEWRRTDPAQFTLSEAQLQPADDSLRIGFDPVAPELIHAGVILSDMQTALRQFPALVEKHLFKTGPPKGLLKYAFLHQAFWKQGLFLYVPEGIRIETPLNAWIESSSSGPAVFPHTLVVLERGAAATLVAEHRSAGAHAGPVVSNQMTEIVLEEASDFRYLHIQRWGSSTAELLIQQASLEKEAHFLNVAVALGGRLTKAHVETALRGQGGRADLLGAIFGCDNQHFDFHTVQDHQAERTFSDLLYKSALRDSAKAVYTGLIRIEKAAQKSDAYQANRNLLLDDGASADSIPMLEILADDVRCTHGVAVGPVDEDQTYYLMTRGLSPEEAQRIIVGGFFEQVLKRIPVETVNERLMDELTQRLEKR